MTYQMLTPNLKEKWTNPQIDLLIHAYKEETCLYVTSDVNYHNKYFRGEALARVCKTIKQLRPTATPKVCRNKFHNLRNQFNIEHTKVRASYTSGTGTDDIYQPTLWYYPKLMFLENYIKPRKNRNSLENIDDTASLVIEENTQYSQLFENSCEYMNISQENIESEIEEQHISSIIFDNEQDIPANNNGPTSRSYSDEQDVQPTQQRDPISPSSISSSGISRYSSVSQHNSIKRKIQDSSDHDSAVVIHELAESLKQPITISTRQNIANTLDPVDSFVIFLGSLLRSFQDEELKLDLMNNITQTVINAKLTDLQRAKK